jgi:hypothetical protein
MNTMMKGVDLDKYPADNLIGKPDEVCAKVAAFKEAGLDGFYATLFVANTKCATRCAFSPNTRCPLSRPRANRKRCNRSGVSLPQRVLRAVGR